MADNIDLTLCLQTLTQDLTLATVGWTTFHGLDVYFSENVFYKSYMSASMWSLNLELYSYSAVSTTLDNGRPCIDFPINFCYAGERPINTCFRSNLDTKLLVVLTGFSDRIRLYFDTDTDFTIPAVTPIFTLVITTI